MVHQKEIYHVKNYYNHTESPQSQLQKHSLKTFVLLTLLIFTLKLENIKGNLTRSSTPKLKVFLTGMI